MVNTLRLAEGACPEGAAFRELLKASFEPARPRATFTGQYPASCGEKDLNVALLEPNDHVAGMMRQLWPEMGGTWSGAVREGPHTAGRPPAAHPGVAPLAEIVRDINKFSNNVMARQLFLTLGAEDAGAAGKRQKAFSAIRHWLARKGIAAPELVMENGSGLSRIERISAASLAALLQAAWRSPVMPEFISSLPVVAVDGTMRKRLRGEARRRAGAHQDRVSVGCARDSRLRARPQRPPPGRGHAGEPPERPEAQPAMDALLRWVYER